MKQLTIQAYPGALICLGSLIPFFLLAIFGIPLYKDASKLDVPTTMFQGREFLQGLEIAGRMVCTGSTTPQRYLLTRTHLAPGYYWLYLGCINLLSEDKSCWTKTSDHWNGRSCHSNHTTLCCRLPARISTTFRFGLSICCDMAKCHWRVEFLPGGWQSTFSC